MVFNPFKMAVQLKFSQFDDSNAFFFQFQQAPGTNFRKVGKSLHNVTKYVNLVVYRFCYIGLYHYQMQRHVIKTFSLYFS